MAAFFCLNHGLNGFIGLAGFFYFVVFASGREGLREAHVGAKRAKHGAERTPECADPNVVRGTPKYNG
jgi:hypothetical protein